MLPKIKGFTLIEILIALVIFAIMATVTSLTLSNAFKTKQSVDRHANSLGQLQQSYHLLHQDLSHSVPKRMQTQSNRALGSFVGDVDGFTLTRSHHYPLEKTTAARLGRIRYQFKAHTLSRLNLDQKNHRLNTTTLLTEIASFHLSYLDKKHYWHEKWQDWQKNNMPQAVKIQITTQSMGSLEWLIKVSYNESFKIKHG